MPSPLVVVTDSVFPDLRLARQIVEHAGGTLELVGESTSPVIKQAVEEADAVLVTYAKITADIIGNMKRCRIIARFGIGVDNVDLAAATEAGIVVTKVPDYCLEEVADHAMALLLVQARKVAIASSRVHAGGWGVAELTPVHRLRGLVLGLVGFGQIPQLVTPRAQAFGLKVVTYDPYVSQDVLDHAGVERMDLHSLLGMSDFVSIHAPLTAETSHLFSTEAFDRMKTTAHLINTARGPIVDEEALAAALDREEIAGAALDVMENEPPKGSTLFGRGNVILTPHMSFYSVESLADLQRKAAEEVVRVLLGKNPRHPVNPTAMKTRARVE